MNELSTQSIRVVDYNTVLPTEPTTLYYHTSDQERQLPIDPQIVSRSLTSSVTTPQRTFRDDVTLRDGRCILADIPPCYCDSDAVHLLPHCKGNEVRLFLLSIYPRSSLQLR